MTKTTVTQVNLLSQQLTRRFKTMNDLMSQVWLEHELARDTHRQKPKDTNAALMAMTREKKTFFVIGSENSFSGMVLLMIPLGI